jgi:hypothetical protein
MSRRGEAAHPTLKNPLRKFRRFADWLDDKKAIREARKLRRRYEPLIAEAVRRKDATESARLQDEWYVHQDLWMHPVYGRKADRLTTKGRKYGISVPDPKDPMGVRRTRTGR